MALRHLGAQWSRTPLRRVEVGELAAAGVVSRAYFSRLFRAAFGISPTRALERVRISRAEILLTRTDLPVEAIAREVGFADSSHFSHRFTAIHGVPPRVYRTAAHPATSVQDHSGVRRLVHLLWD